MYLKPDAYVPFSSRYAVPPAGLARTDGAVRLPLPRLPARAGSGSSYSPDYTRGSLRDQHFSSPQTVEEIIAGGYLAIPTGDPVTAILTDRRHTAWLGLDDAIAQIRSRYALYEENMNGILYATAAATNALHKWRAERGEPSEKQLDNLQKNLQSLYAQERQERVSLWQDISRLRVTLPEAAQGYLAAQRKLTLLDLPEGDGP